MRHTLLTALLALGSIMTYADEWDGATIAKGFYSGTGTKEDPYLVFTADQLVYFLDQTAKGVTYEGQHIRLMNDVSLASHPGRYNVGKDFHGDFDGCAHSIAFADAAEYESGGFYFPYTASVFMENVYGALHDVDFRYLAGINVQEGGIIYNCRFTVNSISTVVNNLGGTVANCTDTGGSNEASKGFPTGGLVAGSPCHNCVFTHTSRSYGTTGHAASNYPAGSENCGTAASDAERNEWVANHPEHNYKQWPMQFSPAYPDYNITVHYDDSWGLTSYEDEVVQARTAEVMPPTPVTDCTFLGWTLNGETVSAPSAYTHDITFKANWRHEHMAQPTLLTLTFTPSDKAHVAAHQWFCAGDATQTYADNRSTYTIEVKGEGGTLEFDYYAMGEMGYRNDYSAIISIDGQPYVSTYSTVQGHYRETIAKGTHTLRAYTESGSSTAVARLTNVTLSYPSVEIAGQTTTTLGYEHLLGNDANVFFCVTTYTNDDKAIATTPLLRNSLFTDDNTTFASTSDGEAAVIHVDASATSATIPATVSATVAREANELTVTAFSDYAFAGCAQLDEITCHIATPLPLAASAVAGVPSTTRLYVPNASLAAYRNADVWRNFFVEPIAGDIPTNLTATEGSTGTASVTDLSGRKVERTQQGVYILDGHKKMVKD